jgi:type VI secretion system protein VasD
MMLDRRGFLLLSATGLAVGCAAPPPPPPGPAVVSVDVAALPGANPTDAGEDRPVTVALFQLRDVGLFNAADFFALQDDPAAALGGDLVGFEQLSVPPGGGATRQVTLGPDAPYIGVAAFLRAPTGRVWRAAAPVAPGATPRAEVRVGQGGLALTVS